MALERLLASLERDAARQAETLLTDARARASQVAQAADARAAQRKSETLGSREQAQRARAELAVAAARRSARARVLEARARLLDRVFSAVRERLPAAVDSAAFRAALPQRLAAARACLGDAPAVLRCAPGLLATLRAAVTGGDLTVQADSGIASGFVIASTDGALVVDETLETRLAQQRAALALGVVAALAAEAA